AGVEQRVGVEIATRDRAGQRRSHVAPGVEEVAQAIVLVLRLIVHVLAARCCEEGTKINNDEKKISPGPSTASRFICDSISVHLWFSLRPRRSHAAATAAETSTSHRDRTSDRSPRCRGRSDRARRRRSAAR